MKTQKLLIIGAGIGQVPLLRRAKARGIHVTVASIPGDYPCFELADDIIYEDIFNLDVITKEAKKRGITSVISDENDLMMPTVAYVAECLGLPGNQFETVMDYCNKNRFRNVCDAAGIPSPRHLAVNKENKVKLKNLSFPLMVKPADSQSSIGVKKVENEQELNDALESAISKSPTGNAIIEEYFYGKEVVCEGFIDDGKYYLLQFADRKYFDLPEVLIPSQTLFPSSIEKEYQERILECEKKLAAYTRPSFAIVHSEYLINETTGEIRIVESALRGGGVFISSDLIPMSTGIDINDVLLRKALGEEVNIEAIFSGLEKKAAGYVCFYLPEGVIQSVSGVNQLKTMPFVRKMFIDNLRIGMRTTTPSFKGSRLGPILVSGFDRDELYKNIETVQKTLDVKVKQSNKLLGIIWN